MVNYIYLVLTKCEPVGGVDEGEELEGGIQIIFPTQELANRAVDERMEIVLAKGRKNDTITFARKEVTTIGTHEGCHSAKVVTMDGNWFVWAEKHEICYLYPQDRDFMVHSPQSGWA